LLDTMLDAMLDVLLDALKKKIICPTSGVAGRIN
jgi:hypothetical protein